MNNQYSLHRYAFLEYPRPVCSRAGEGGTLVSWLVRRIVEKRREGTEQRHRNFAWREISSGLRALPHHLFSRPDTAVSRS
jgi:hypothetical protein